MTHDVGTGTPPDRATVGGQSWVSWGAIFSGALIGVAIMTLLALFWWAVAVGGNWVASNIYWFLGGSAIVATFLAGVFAGWLSSGRGPLSGLVQGLTEWGLLTFAVVIVGPGLAAILRALLVTRGAVTEQTWLWASFWSVVVGLGAALLGGALGSTMVSPFSDPARIGVGNAPTSGVDPTQSGSDPRTSSDPHGTSPEHRRPSQR